MSKPTRDELNEYADENEKLAKFRRAQADLYDNTAKQSRAGILIENEEDDRLQQAVRDTGKKLPKGLKYLRKGI
jgi:hypothetical protein